MDEQLCFLEFGEREPDIASARHHPGAKETLAKVISICPHCDHTSIAMTNVKSWIIANLVRGGVWEKTGENEYTQHVQCEDENCPGRP